MKKTEIARVRRATEREWDDTWRACQYATFFHSREWSEAWSAYTKGALTPHARVVEFKDNKRALLPATLKKGLLSGRFIMSPAGTYGGWISADDLGAPHARAIFDLVLNETQDLFWRINPYDPLLMDKGVENVYSRAFADDNTHYLDLRGGLDEVRGKWNTRNGSIMNKIRKAEKMGVTVRRANSLKDWRDYYYSVYQDSLRKWGDNASSVFGWGLFEALYKLHSDNVVLWVADYNGEMIAGGLNLYASRHMVVWHGSSLEKHLSLRPVNLLTNEMVKDACERGCWWFDFNPSGGHEGVKRFKESFGAIEISCPSLDRRTWAELALKKAKKPYKTVVSLGKKVRVALFSAEAAETTKRAQGE